MVDLKPFCNVKLVEWWRGELDCFRANKFILYTRIVSQICLLIQKLVICWRHFLWAPNKALYTVSIASKDRFEKTVTVSSLSTLCLPIYCFHHQQALIVPCAWQGMRDAERLFGLNLVNLCKNLWMNAWGSLTRHVAAYGVLPHIGLLWSTTLSVRDLSGKNYGKKWHDTAQWFPFPGFSRWNDGLQAHKSGNSKRLWFTRDKLNGSISRSRCEKACQIIQHSTGEKATLLIAKNITNESKTYDIYAIDAEHLYMHAQEDHKKIKSTP